MIASVELVASESTQPPKVCFAFIWNDTLSAGHPDRDRLPCQSVVLEDKQGEERNRPMRSRVERAVSSSKHSKTKNGTGLRGPELSEPSRPKKHLKRQTVQRQSVNALVDTPE